MELSIAKREIRESIKKILLTITQDELTRQSINILKSLEKIPEFEGAKNIALYMNMPNLEVKTLPIIRACFERNLNLYLPKCIYSSDAGRKKNHLRMLQMSSLNEVLQLQPQGKYKLLEPVQGNDLFDCEEGLDVIIVPGVAFSREKKRLGHGAGFYDEFLTVHKVKFGKSPFMIGIGLAQQLVDEIPTETHDWDLDCIIIDGVTFRGT